MLPDLSKSAIEKASQQDDLIEKTAQQIIKDFAEFGFEITFSGNTNGFYNELWVQMHTVVRNMINNDQSRFNAMLYRIDISNKDIALYSNEMQDSTYAEMITTLIIHRELKKVITREYFKHHNK